MQQEIAEDNPVEPASPSGPIIKMDKQIQNPDSGFQDLLKVLAKKHQSALEKYKNVNSEIEKVLDDDIVTIKFLRHIDEIK